MEGRKCIVWFRNDLRLHDHQPLVEAVKRGGTVYPVYCLDTAILYPSAHGPLRIGAYRARFVYQSLLNLQKRLREKGAELIFLTGIPEEEITRFAVEKGVSSVYGYKEVATEEVATADRLENQLFKHRIALELYLGNTLFNKEDLPFPIRDVPDTFSAFKKRVERDSFVRKSFAEPVTLNGDPLCQPACIPTPSSLGIPEAIDDNRSAMHFEGGEEAGLLRLHEYIWEKELIANYKNTRNGLVGSDYSSKLSAWLSHGCLSPRKVYEEIKAFENDRVSNTSTEWLFYELLWRDYFRFVFKKYGPKLFLAKGLKDKAPPFQLENEDRNFTLWKNGLTGIPFIDANMIELRSSGFMSNRGRQVAASFLVHDLKVRWRKGAALYEENLIDYNPASNWGNWAYIAGVGNDPRENRYFNVLKQAYDYDPQGRYVKLWIPELESLPSYLVHQPWIMTSAQSDLYGIRCGNNYPCPLVEFKKYEKQY